MNQDRSLQGIALCALAYAFLGLQDAAIKWLVADYSVFSILFWRSLVVVGACVIAGRMGLLRRAWSSASSRLPKVPTITPSFLRATVKLSATGSGSTRQRIA